MRLDSEQQQLIVSNLEAVRRALRFLRCADIELESEAQYVLCRLVRSKKFPRDRPQPEQEAWAFTIIKRHLIRQLARRKHPAQLDDSFGHEADAPAILQQERDRELAQKELDEYEAAHARPGNFSRKQALINRLKRKRLYGSSRRIKKQIRKPNPPAEC